MSDKKPAPRRAAYPHLSALETRFLDNDVYGHVNNVAYYSFFDTIINRYLIDAGGLDIHDGAIVGFAVESGCTFRRAVRFPERLTGGLRVAHLGESSVRYEVGIFREGEDDAAAHGYFVHVFVDRATNLPTRIPDRLRDAMAFLR